MLVGENIRKFRKEKGLTQKIGRTIWNKRSPNTPI